MEAAPHPWPALGVLLLRDGLVEKDALEALLSEQHDSRQQRISGWRLGEILVERGMVTPADVARLIAEQYELPYLTLERKDVDPAVAALLPIELVERFSALPISRLPDGSLLLAVADPAAVLFSDELRRALGLPLRFAVVPPDAMAESIAARKAYDVLHGAGSNGVPVAPDVDEVVVLDQEQSDGDAALRGRDEALRGLRFVDPSTHSWPPLGALLVREGLVSESELEAALAQQRLSVNRRLGEILIERGSVTRADVARLVAEQYELSFIDVDVSEIDPAVAGLLPTELAERYSALPLRFMPDGSLLVAVSDPTSVRDPEEILKAVGARLTFAVADPDTIDTAIARRRHGLLEAPPAPEPAQPVAVVPVVEPPAPEETAAEPFEDEVDEPPPVTSEDVHEQALPVTSEEMDEEPTEDDSLSVKGLLEDLFPVDVAEDVSTDDSPEHPGVVSLELVETEPEPGAEPRPLAVVEEAPPAPPVQTVGEVVEPPLYVVEEAAPAEPEPEVVPERGGPAEPEAELEVVFDEPETIETEEPADEDALVTEEVAETAAVEVVALEAEPQEEPAPSAASHELEETLERAVALGASTIHLSPSDVGVRIRARVDGVVRELGVIASPLPGELTAALRNGTIGSHDELEVAVLPTRHGDRATVQLRVELPARGLSELGLATEAEEVVRRTLDQPSGAVLVYGPAGSGRTTTLYAALEALATSERTLLTIEDPVERALAGVDQVEVDPKAGLTFARGLRTLLRSDADVVLVGDLPDGATAQTAVQAAMSGRFVLSTLPALTAAGALERLGELGVLRGLLASSVTCLVGQRLLRRLCPDCRETYYPDAEELVELGRPEDEAGRRLLARGRGCESCAGTGFQGRVAVFEVLLLDRDLRTLVANGTPAVEVERAAVAMGMRSLREEALRHCLDGITTAAEIRRTLGDSAVA